MASAKDLTDEQKASVQSWADAGESLGEIQARMRDEFELAGLTFLDARLLLAELGISLKEEEKKTTGEDAGAGAADALAGGGAGDVVEGEVVSQEAVSDGGEPPSPAGDVPDEAVPAPGGAGKATVSMHEVTPPGMLAAGSVTFGDGEKAEWYLDQMGRLGLDPATEGYRPSQEDVVAFQDELQKMATGL
ncbi:MAG: hypothetical protein AAF591_08000 [Verrucomicrobiota bacterium]